MIDRQEFNFKPTKSYDSVTIYEAGMKIVVEVSYNSLLDLVVQLNEEEKYDLLVAMKILP